MKNLAKKKGSSKIIAITAYDALFAGIFDGEVDLILVGDSLNQSFNGRRDTLSVSMDEMIYHTKAVGRAIKKTPILADMPFGSYVDEKSGVLNATRFYKETNASAVKLEGGIERLDVIRAILSQGIAVVGHIGLMPQFARMEGGYFIKGKSEQSKNYLLESALALQEAGVMALVLEGIKSEVAATITQELKIPTIGIGSGAMCDGQILVWSDAFGFFDEFKPKFVRYFLNGKELIKDALKRYRQSVQSGDFPKSDESY